MKATGIVRRIDELGRVVIPKEIRRTQRIRRGDPLEIFTTGDGEVIFKKYSPIGEMNAVAAQYTEVLSKSFALTALVADRDRILTVSGSGRRELADRSISQPLEKLMDGRRLYQSEGIAEKCILPCEGSPRAVLCAAPIIAAGDVTGVVALLEHHLAQHHVQLRTGCTVRTLSQSRSGYAVQFETAEGSTETLRADAVICAMGGEAGPQFGTDGFGTRFAAQCGGRVEPLYPCLTALQCAKPRKALAGIRAKAAASLLDGARVLACENGEVQFTDYGLSGICIMQLSGLLAPGRGPKAPAVELDLFPAVDETALASLFAAHAAQTAGGSAADFWLGLLNQKLGRTVWSAAGLQDSDAPAVLTAAQWQKLAHTAKHWRFEGLTPCSWKQAQTTGGGLALREVDQHFQFKGCPGLYFVGETLDCAGSCGGFNLHWAFGSGLVAGRSAAGHAAAGRALPKAPAPAKSRKKPHR